MRTKLIESNKPEKIIHNIRYVDTNTNFQTVTVGTPLVLNLSATPQPTTYQNGLPPGWEDGLQVVLPSTGGFVGSQLFLYGVAIGPIVAQQLGEVMMHGVCLASVVRQTRSASSASWSSGSSVAGFGAFLVVDTVNNVFITQASASTGSPVILLDNLISYAGVATASTDTRTIITQLCRAFVRNM